ncbi:hypothetical protein PM082_003619 [Marasmius tenuissimus]|nr:hypothetical protein PM082_003619 [Marasmius tenuissimus]
MTEIPRIFAENGWYNERTWRSPQNLGTLSSTNDPNARLTFIFSQPAIAFYYYGIGRAYRGVDGLNKTDNGQNPPEILKQRWTGSCSRYWTTLWRVQHKHNPRHLFLPRPRPPPTESTSTLSASSSSLATSTSEKSGSLSNASTLSSSRSTATPGPSSSPKSNSTSSTHVINIAGSIGVGF